MNETEFTPRCLSGAAELEIDFYRDLYELGVWWALLSSYDRETRARRVLERSLYNVEGFRAALGRPDVYALADIDLDLQLRSETSHIVKVCDELADSMGWSLAVGYAFGLQIKKEER